MNLPHHGNLPHGGHPSPVPVPIDRPRATGKVAALTFDDGPHGADTERLLDFLASVSVRAVFCLVGSEITQPGGASLVTRIVAEGHVVANHSTSFADMGGWSADAVRADLMANLTTIRDAAGDPDLPVPYWRAPNGSWGVTCDVAVELGMQPLGVVGAIGDWEEQDATVLAARLDAAMTPGSMVLAHDGGGERAGTVTAVIEVVTARLAEGWEFVLPEQ